MTVRLTSLCVLAALWCAGPVSAAETKRDDEAALIGQSAPPKYDEIERGLWFSVETAPIGHIDWVSTLPPRRLTQVLPDDAGWGWRMGARVGFDILKLVSVDGFFVGQGKDKRVRRLQFATGDMMDLTAGVGLRLMPITIKDRLAFTGRVGLGLSWVHPGEMAAAQSNPGCLPPTNTKEPINPLCVRFPAIDTPDNPLGIDPFPGMIHAISPMAEVNLGVEYFTKLRHFSVGAELTMGALFWPFQLHAGIVPHVKYSF